MVFYATLGIILGGRLGYVIFYRPLWYIENPLEIPQLWDGGMSFHGGVIGVTLGILWMARKHKLDWLRIHDYVACCVPFGLFLGRLANFVNHELWGRATDVAWPSIPGSADRSLQSPWRPAAGGRAAPSEPALAAGPKDPPVPSSGTSSEDPRPLPAGQAGRHFHPGYGLAPSPWNSSANRTANGSSSPRSPIFAGVAVLPMIIAGLTWS
jgi:hypothetical protein